MGYVALLRKTPRDAASHDCPVSTKAWHKLPVPPPGFSRELDLSPFHAHLLFNRGVRSSSEARSYLAVDASLANDPFLLPDMDRAVARLRGAVESGEGIGIFGDFDTDGITGTALLTTALRDIGATVLPYLPHRVDEGHGLSRQAVRTLSDSGVSLIVTVDCGATSVDEVAFATSLGVDTIVTDHHPLHSSWPAACAVIDPQRSDSRYPYPHLTGVGMAYKLIEALYDDLGRAPPERLLELVALGTVADVGPLTGENRYFVKRGLEALNTTSNLGIRALVATSGAKLGSLDTEALSFGLIPRLNVAGRMGHANTSLHLLTATSSTEAERLAAELEQQNTARRELTEQNVREAMEEVEAESAVSGVPSIIVVGRAEWTPGILGLIAGRLSESYNRPAVAISIGEELSRASARSIPEFDIASAFAECEQHFLRFGGHPQAAGFTASTHELDTLKQRLRALADRGLDGLELIPSIAVDCEVSPALFKGESFDFVQSLAPFGAGNRAPVFLTRYARVVRAHQVGRNGRHLKLRLWHGGDFWDAIAFRQGERIDVAQGKIDFLYTVDLNTWGDIPTLQLKVLDFQAARA